MLMQAMITKGQQSSLEHIAIPTCAADEVLVRIFAAGVNPIDRKVQQNGALLGDGDSFVLGCDGAGIIEAVGEDVTQYTAGDAVFYCYGGIGQSAGNYAEYACIPAQCLAIKPESMNMIQAAAAPLVLITAWESLFDRAHMYGEQTVLILGGTGGVGHIALQLAKIAGCRVACTVSSAKKAALAYEYGADCVIDRSQEDITEAIHRWTDGRGVDVLLDTVGGKALPPVLGALANYGTLVSLLQFADDLDWKTLRLKNITLAQTLMLSPMLLGDKQGLAHQAAILEQCAQMIDSEQLRLHVSTILSLNQAKDALDAIAKGDTMGKIVLDCTGSDQDEP